MVTKMGRGGRFTNGVKRMFASLRESQRSQIDDYSSIGFPPTRTATTTTTDAKTPLRPDYDDYCQPLPLLVL